MMARAERFEIAIPQSDIDDLRSRLAHTRFADDFANESWRYGVEGNYLRELVAYWHDAYDWRAVEADINSYPHHRVEIDDVPVHFMHVRGTGPAPLPLVLTHGWPWTFWDFHKVVRPLTDPASFGGDPADAFDLVVPSLPGYGFSSPLRRTGVSAAVTARLWVRLMREVLGYPRFGAHGGDWGALVSANIGHAFAEDVVGIHLSMPLVMTMLPYQVKPEDYGAGEEGWHERMLSRLRMARSHVAVHRDDPQTLAWALNDSPAGLAAWIIERRRAWSDCDGDIERRFSKDDLLTAISIYWFTQTFHTSARYYAESFGGRPQLAHDRKPAIEAPTGVAVFPQDLMLLPRALVAQHANLVHWTVMPRGGHFAALEEPELLAQDIREFFRPLK
jgi:pimeloyl-ACP methyl ester carboxylesterase